MLIAATAATHSNNRLKTPYTQAMGKFKAGLGSAAQAGLEHLGSSNLLASASTEGSEALLCQPLRVTEEFLSREKEMSSCLDELVLSEVSVLPGFAVFIWVTTAD